MAKLCMIPWIENNSFNNENHNREYKIYCYKFDKIKFQDRMQEVYAAHFLIVLDLILTLRWLTHLNNSCHAITRLLASLKALKNTHTHTQITFEKDHDYLIHHTVVTIITSAFPPTLIQLPKFVASFSLLVCLLCVHLVLWANSTNLLVSHPDLDNICK